MNETLIKKLHKAYIKKDEKLLRLLFKRHTPSSLIKFCSGTYDRNGNNNYLDSLKNNVLWLSSPKYFNDPFDALHNIDCEELARSAFDDLAFVKGKRKKTENINPQEKEKIISSWTDVFSVSWKKIKDNSYMACFSEKLSLTSSSMWGYYAN